MLAGLFNMFVFMDRRIVLLCGVNGSGKSTLSEEIKKLGYDIVDVDASNFDTSQKVDKYYEYFLKYLTSKSWKGKLTLESFREEFHSLYNGACNNDASLTLLTMYEQFTKIRIPEEKREFEIDYLYKEVLAPVYLEDTKINIETAIGEGKNMMCIDVGSRKFFFVNDEFICFLESRGYHVDVFYLDSDIQRNVDNLFNIKNDIYVIFDRLNLTGVVKEFFSSYNEYRAISEKLTSKIPTEKEEAFRNITVLLETNTELKSKVKELVKKYMVVRATTLGEHLEELKNGEHSEILHRLFIKNRDSVGELFQTITGLLSPTQQSADSPYRELSSSDYLPRASADCGAASSSVSRTVLQNVADTPAIVSTTDLSTAHKKRELDSSSAEIPTTLQQDPPKRQVVATEEAPVIQSTFLPTQPRFQSSILSGRAEIGVYN